MRRTNEEIYKAEINVYSDYKISKNDFICWLNETEGKKEIKRALYDMQKGILDIYDIAVDFSIPIILVKALMKEYL